jgi:hypothetical protein
MYIESKYTPILPYESGMPSKERGRENISMRAVVDEIERLQSSISREKTSPEYINIYCSVSTYLERGIIDLTKDYLAKTL